MSLMKGLAERKITAYLERNWHKREAGAAVATLALFGGIGPFAVLIPDSLIASLVIAPFLGAALATLLWYRSTLIEVTPAGRVGFVIAIACENEKHEKQFRNDFIEKLRRQLEADAGLTQLHLLVCPRNRVEAVSASQKSTKKYLCEARSLFAITGTVMKRLDATGAPSFFIRFDGLVRHPETTDEQKALLRAEFTSVWPSAVTIPVKGSMFHFDVTASWMEIAALFTIGLASIISGNLAYSAQLLTLVEAKIADPNRALLQGADIKKKVAHYLKLVHAARLSVVVAEHTRTRDRQMLKVAAEIADELLKREPKAYSALLLRAMAYFELERNITGARRLLKTAKGPDVTYRYGLAFLAAYEGNLIGAEREYLGAFKGPTADPSVPVQCEEFIQLVLTDEPHQGRLHYCSALINLQAKKDLAGAVRDFKAFLGSEDSHQFPKQRVAAEQRLAALGATKGVDGIVAA